MVRTGEVRPNNNLKGAYARNLSHKDNVIFVRFLFWKKHRLFFMRNWRDNPAVDDDLFQIKV